MLLLVLEERPSIPGSLLSAIPAVPLVQVGTLLPLARNWVEVLPPSSSSLSSTRLLQDGCSLAWALHACVRAVCGLVINEPILYAIVRRSVL